MVMVRAGLGSELRQVLGSWLLFGSASELDFWVSLNSFGAGRNSIVVETMFNFIDPNPNANP